VENVVTPQLRDTVLERLGLSAAPSIDPEGLATIYEAWCRNVPFDNVRKWIAVSRGDVEALPGSTAEDFFQAWLQHRTGGTCWAGNGALCELLKSCGFDVARGVCTMLVAPDLPPNHGTVVAKFDGEEYLVDASILHLKPMRLNVHISVAYPYAVQLEFEQEQWQIHWRPANHPNGLTCRVDYFPTTDADFQQRHEFTRAWSPFNYSLAIRSLRGRCVIGAFGLEWYQMSADGKTERREVTRNERSEMLVEQLGYSEEIIAQLPIDQAVPPPPGSRAAAAIQQQALPE
jgi:N-hydroxyarylamine O-acetyltransferase